MYIQHFCMEVVYQKFDIKWTYLRCLIFGDTAFLFCEAEIVNHTVNIRFKYKLNGICDTVRFLSVVNNWTYYLFKMYF